MYQPYVTMEEVAGIATPGADPERERFTGKEFDREGEDAGNGVSGLNAYYFGARYLDADIGMWTSCDPADEFWSPYSYGPNDPINGFDHDGKVWSKVFNWVINWAAKKIARWESGKALNAQKELSTIANVHYDQLILNVYKNKNLDVIQQAEAVKALNFEREHILQRITNEIDSKAGLGDWSMLRMAMDIQNTLSKSFIDFGGLVIPTQPTITNPTTTVYVEGTDIINTGSAYDGFE